MNTYQDVRKCFITQDPFCLRMLDRLQDIAMSDATVLITGESGTGKKLIANTIHQLGPYAARPLISVYCGTDNANLREASMPNGGTLLLADINNASNEFQKRLSQFLETNSYHSPSSKKSDSTNIRIITTASSNMRKAVREGKLRKDLYDRLSALEINIYPLRSRWNDKLLLVEHFVEIFKSKYDRPNTILSKEAIKYLHNHPLYGNTPELQSMIERGFAKCRNDNIQIRDIISDSLPALDYTYDEYMKKAAKIIQKDYLEIVMTECNGDVPLAAKIADVDRSHFYKMLRDHELNLDDFRSDKNDD